MLFFKPCTKNYNHNFCSILSRKLKAITVLNNRKWHRITSSHLTSFEKKNTASRNMQLEKLLSLHANLKDIIEKA